jgi:hypothetical protein
MPLPTVVRFKHKLVVEEAKRRGKLRKSATVREDFDFRGRRFLVVPAIVFFDKRVQANIASLLKEVNGIPRLSTEKARLDAFNRALGQSHYDNIFFTTFLMAWKQQNGVTSLQDKEDDLLDALLSRLKVPDTLRKFYQLKLQFDDDRDLRQEAFDLQIEFDRQEATLDLISDVAPRAAFAVAGLFPPTAGGAVLAFAVDAFINLYQFFDFMAEAEADGEITEDEAQEAWWQLIGILPFKIVELVLLSRSVIELVKALGQIGIALLEMLYEALVALPDIISNWQMAIEDGWSNVNDMDRACEIFIPLYAIDDLKRTSK